jgi:hypothetical protein
VVINQVELCLSAPAELLPLLLFFSSERIIIVFFNNWTMCRDNVVDGILAEFIDIFGVLVV